MNRRRQQVRRIYQVLWDAQDNEAIPTVLHESFTFKGSLDQETRGHNGFADYLDMVLASLAPATTYADTHLRASMAGK